jgi:hypothetical protein
VRTRIVLWLADGPPRNTGPDFGKASPFGLLIVVLLLICTGFLVWSMNRHLKKLPERFDRTNPEPDQAADDGTVGRQDATGADTTNDSGSPPHEPGG